MIEKLKNMITGKYKAMAVSTILSIIRIVAENFLKFFFKIKI